MNNSAISISLFGKKIHYYLKCLWNIQSFKKHNVFNEFDYVINCDNDAYILLTNIAEQENIIFPEQVKFKKDFLPNTYFRGSFWRFYPIISNEYNFIYIADADDFITDLYLYLYINFKQQNMPFGMWKDGNVKTTSLAGTGRTFFNIQKCNLEFINHIKKCLNMIDNIKETSYGHDNLFVNVILQNQFLNNVFYYIQTKNEYTVQYIKSHCNNTVDISNLEKTLPKKVTVDKNHFLEIFKYVDIKNKKYKIKNTEYLIDRNYDGLTCENIQLRNRAYSIIRDKCIF